eukprot:scaffold371_cov268-Chaetoceros_neogracile.AAC.13
MVRGGSRYGTGPRQMNARHGTPGNSRLSNNAGQQRVDFMFSAARTNNSTAGTAENGDIAAASSDDNDADLAEDGNNAEIGDNPVGTTSPIIILGEEEEA